MTSWKPRLVGRKGPKYERLVDAIDEAVRTGALAPGAKLPPQRDLAWKLGVTVGTVGRAYAIAEQRRLVSGHVGRGTYVMDAQKDQDPAPAANGPIDLTRNVPMVEAQVAALAETLAEMSRSPALRPLLEYQPENGQRRYREAGAIWMKRVGLDVSADRVIVTGGVQHGLAMALLALAKPGEAVLTEKLTFSGVPNAMRLNGARPVGVAMDDEGALPEALDRAARETGARLAFLTPTVHSPTVALMSDARRRAIADVARRRDLTLIEDDVYGYLPVDRPAPIATIAPERTLYLTGTSKCLAPGLRVAWMAAPQPLIEKLGAVLHATALGLPTLGAEVAARWIADGTAARLVDQLRAEIAARHGLASVALQGLKWRGRPDAMQVFIDLPDIWRSEDFAAEAQRRGVAICPAQVFAIDPADAPNAVRIVLGATRQRETLQRALSLIAELASGVSADTLRRRIV